MGGTGYWVMSIAYWVLGIGYWVLVILYWVLGIGHTVLGIGRYEGLGWYSQCTRTALGPLEGVREGEVSTKRRRKGPQLQHGGY